MWALSLYSITQLRGCNNQINMSRSLFIYLNAQVGTFGEQLERIRQPYKKVGSFLY
jgi:hypothetical protein